jgi:hypothetical protein
MVLTKPWVKKVAAILIGAVIVFTPATVIALTPHSSAHKEQSLPDIVESVNTDPIGELSTPIVGKSNDQIEKENTKKEISKSNKSEVVAHHIVPQDVTDLKLQAQTLVVVAWGLSEWEAFDWIIRKESGWNHLAVNKHSGATGICQSLPAKKMQSAGDDYLTNPLTQVKWCISYIKQRYGTPTEARYFHKEHNWF